ncbi:hypothetical protein SEVIR_6G167801v4 [Setaria viridis]
MPSRARVADGSSRPRPMTPEHRAPPVLKPNGSSKARRKRQLHQGPSPLPHPPSLPASTPSPCTAQQSPLVLPPPTPAKATGQRARGTRSRPPRPAPPGSPRHKLRAPKHTDRCVSQAPPPALAVASLPRNLATSCGTGKHVATRSSFGNRLQLALVPVPCSNQSGPFQAFRR